MTILFLLLFSSPVHAAVDDRYVRTATDIWTRAYPDAAVSKAAEADHPAYPYVHPTRAGAIEVDFPKGTIYLADSDLHPALIEYSSGPEPLRQPLPDATLWRSIEAFEERLGHRLPVHSFYHERENNGSAMVVSFQYTAVYDGVRLGLESAAIADVQEGTGRVVYFIAPLTEVVPPPDLTPTISFDQAKIAAAAYMFGCRNSARIDFSSMSHLEIWAAEPVKETELFKQFLTPEQLAASKRHVGILAYWLVCLGSGSSDGQTGSPLKNIVYVDAQTGRVLQDQIRDYGGYGGTSKSPIPSTFAWDVGPMPISILGAPRPAVGRIDLCPPPKKVAKDWRPVALGFANAIVRAEYSPSLGALRTAGAGGRKYGRPSGAVRSALAGSEAQHATGRRKPVSQSVGCRGSAPAEPCPVAGS